MRVKTLILRHPYVMACAVATTIATMTLVGCQQDGQMLDSDAEQFDQPARAVLPADATLTYVEHVWDSRAFESVANMAPTRVQLRIEMDHRQLELELERNDELFARGYAEQRIGADGMPEMHPPSAWANARPCFYQGQVYDVSSGGAEARLVGMASVSTCDQIGEDVLSGLVRVDGIDYSVEPTMAAGRTPGAQVLHKVEALESIYGAMDAPPTCGVGQHVVPLGTRQGALDTAVLDPELAAASGPVFVEHRLVNDVARFTAKGGATESESALITNVMTGLYLNGVANAQGDGFAREVRVILQGQTTFTSSDPYTVELFVNGEANTVLLLDAFNQWAASNVADNDNHQLFSGLDFAGSTIGLAPLGTMCLGALSGSVNQTTHNVAVSAVTAAHELGHNFGLDHDGENDNACSA
ncbi:MAG: hypothetical protein ACI9WU_002372, partial [Myxococcota bacterium]